MLRGRYYPGIRAGPALQYRLHHLPIQRRNERTQLCEIGGDQNQTLVQLSPLEEEQPLHRGAIQWITTQPIDRLGRVGDDSSAKNDASRLTQFPWLDQF